MSRRRYRFGHTNLGVETYGAQKTRMRKIERNRESIGKGKMCIERTEMYIEN